MKIIAIPAQTIAVEDGPASLAHAIENMDATGDFSANVKLPVKTIKNRDISYDDFYDRLAAALVSDCEASNLKYTILGTSADGADFYVKITNCVADMADLDEDTLNEKVPADVIDAAFARLTIQPVAMSIANDANAVQE
jgi:hypothetical protein